MKTILSVTFAIFILAGGSLILWRGFSYSENNEEIATQDLYANIGIVPTGSLEITHTFLWHNHSTQPVRVLKTITTCGCSKLQISPEAIEPGKSANVSMTVDLRNRYGKQRFEGRIVTDDPAHPYMSVLLNLVVPDPIQASPPAIEFGRLSPQQEYVGRIDVKGPKGGIHVQQINPLPTNIQVSVENENFSEISSKVGLKVIIHGVPQPKQEAFVLEFEALASGIHAKRKFKIPIYGRYDGILRVNPHILSLSTQKGLCSTFIVETDGPEEPVVSTADSSFLILEMEKSIRTEKGWTRKIRVCYRAKQDKAEPKRTEQLEVRAGAISTCVPVVFR